MDFLDENSANHRSLQNLHNETCESLLEDRVETDSNSDSRISISPSE